MKPKVLMINPWIYDFAAYDLWSKPLGLFSIAAMLRHRGLQVHLIDCLDIHHPGMKQDLSLSPPVRRSYGTGKFWRQKVSKPSPLKKVPRTYSRYGITGHLFQRDLEKIPRPDAILVTSLMTYWYPGVQEAITLSREIFPEVPIILGGIYARLCPEHARKYSGADRVISQGGTNAVRALESVLGEFNIPFQNDALDTEGLSYPAFDLLRIIDYVCLMTSIGCPYRCRYCASHYINPDFSKRDPERVLEEISYWHMNYGVRDFAFYDDALLVGSNTHIIPLLEAVAGQDMAVRFHTPNALHVREISGAVADLLKASGFRTIRLGFETADMALHDHLDRKVSKGEFERAVNNLERAGFPPGDIGAYILMGLPNQSVDSVMDSIAYVADTGATPYLAEYSPLPHTPMWKEAIASSQLDLAGEPLFHNNSLLPCWDERRKAEVPRLKKRVREIREDLKARS
ncbi:B12-binding domain-containing radical SAM protein [Thermodesulfobacteriota bacterium]